MEAVGEADFQFGNCIRRVAHTCTDNSNLLSLHFDILRRPERRVVDDSSELLDALIIRNISLSSKASGNDEESCLAGTSISSLDSPFSSLLVKFCRGDNGLKRSVFAQIADFVTMVKVGLQFPPVWIVCGKAERVVNLGDCQLVDWDRAVDSSSWIAVPPPNVWIPVRACFIEFLLECISIGQRPAAGGCTSCELYLPSATISGASVIKNRVISLLPHLIEQVNPTEASSNDEDIDVQVVSIWSRGVSPTSILGELGLDNPLREFLGCCRCHISWLFLFSEKVIEEFSIECPRPLLFISWTRLQYSLPHPRAVVALLLMWHPIILCKRIVGESSWG